MDPLPKCGHRVIQITGSWQANMGGRIICMLCGSDKLLDRTEVEQYERLKTESAETGARYLAGLLPS